MILEAIKKSKAKYAIINMPLNTTRQNDKNRVKKKAPWILS